MKHTVKILWKTVMAFALMYGLAACHQTENKVNMVQTLNATGDVFFDTLHRDFSTLSKFEYDGGDIKSADLFAQHAEAAASNTIPNLTNPANVKVPESARTMLTEQYRDILSRLETNERHAHPRYLAKAISNYECRIEQIAENRQQDHVLACGEHIARFETQEQMIQEIRSQAVETRVIEERLAPVPVDFTIYFPFDADKIVGEGQNAVDDIVVLMNYKPSLSVTLVGHADRSGNDAYNAGLSQRRANHARQAILARGIAPARVGIDYRGERLNAKPTADNQREGYNRRVEVEFSEPEIEIEPALLNLLRLNDSQPIGR